MDSMDPQQQQQQTAQGGAQVHDGSNGACVESEEVKFIQSSFPTDAVNEDRRDTTAGGSPVTPSLEGSGGGGGGGKMPNSYKYPLLKRYFEFGPWVGRNRKALCLACHIQTSSSQPDRLLKHLNRCSSLTEEDKAVVTELMNERTANKRKKPMQLRLKRNNEFFGDEDQNTSFGSGQVSLSGTDLKRIKRDPQDINSQIDEALTRFIMMCRIPLKSIHSKEFVEFCRALNPNYQIPSQETITNVLIPGLLNIL